MRVLKQPLSTEPWSWLRPQLDSSWIWLIFNADGKIFRISLDGQLGPGWIHTVLPENLNKNHVLSSDSKLISFSSRNKHLYRVAIEAGKPQHVSNKHNATQNTRCWDFSRWDDVSLHRFGVPDGGKREQEFIEFKPGRVRNSFWSVEVYLLTK